MHSTQEVDSISEVNIFMVGPANRLPYDVAHEAGDEILFVAIETGIDILVRSSQGSSCRLKGLHP